jgi:hypothetical protein
MWRVAHFAALSYSARASDVATIKDTLQLDIKGVDGVETITFTAVRATTTNSYTVTHAVCEELSLHEVAASGGLFQVGDKRWWFSAAAITLAADSPRQGDRLTAAGVTHQVVGDATLDAVGALWVVVTRRNR